MTSTSYATQYPQFFQPTAVENFAPRVDTMPTATATTGTASNIQTAYTVRDLAKEYSNMGKLATQVENLENANQAMHGRLNHIGIQLKDLGRDPIEFKANPLENLAVNPNRSLNESRQILENHGKVVEKEIKEGLRKEIKAKHAVEEEKYVKSQFDDLVNNQHKAAHQHKHNFRNHGHHHHNHHYNHHHHGYSKHHKHDGTEFELEKMAADAFNAASNAAAKVVQRVSKMDLPTLGAAVAFVATGNLFSGLSNSFVTYVVLKSAGF